MSSSLPANLRVLLGFLQEKAGVLFSPRRGESYIGAMELLEQKVSLAEYPEKEELKQLLGEVRNYFQTSAVKGRYEENNGYVYISVDANAEKAVAVFTPPREGGEPISVNKAVKASVDAGVCSGLDMTTLMRGVDACLEQNDIIMNLVIARGSQPVDGEDSRIDFTVSPLDIDALFQDPLRAKQIGNEVERVKKGDEVGLFLAETAGEPGKTVTGKDLPARNGVHRNISLQEGLQQNADGVIIAEKEGIVVKKGDSISLQELYQINHTLHSSPKRLFFDGTILVEGSVKGDVEMIGNDIIILGRLERGRVYAKGDLLVLGGIFGKRESTVFAEGRLLTYAITDAKVDAGGDIIVGQNIYNAEVNCRSTVRVNVKRGVIVGGKTEALKGVETCSFGGSFGVFAEVVSGVDLFSAAKRKKIEAHTLKLMEQKGKLSEIHDKLLKNYGSVDAMPEERQDVFLNLQQRLRYLEQELAFFESELSGTYTAMEEEPSATVRVFRELYPPLRVAICKAEQEIEKKMQNVRICYDKRAKTLRIHQQPVSI